MADGLDTGSVYYTVEADTSPLVNIAKTTDASLSKLESRLGKTDQAASKANHRLTKTAAAVRGLGKESGIAAELAKSLGRVLAGLVSIKTASILIKMANDYNEMAERIRMATSSTFEFNKVQDRLLTTANGTYRSLSEAQEVYIQTADSLRSLGYSTDEVLDITDSLSYSFVKNATSADRAQSAMNAFTKGVNKGTVDAEGWQTILAAVPTVVDDIAKATGKSASQIRAMGFAGKLAAKDLNEGLRQSLDNNKAAADGMATTVSDAFVAVRNSISVLVGKANQATGVTDDLARSITRVAEAIQDVDIQSLVREIDSIKATVALVSDGIDALFADMQGGADSVKNTVNRSFADMALTTGKEVDGIAKVFQGTAGAVSAVWEALANNIPAFFANAWNEVKQDAANFVNGLADMINKPLRALGQEGIGHVDFNVDGQRAIRDLTEAARDGWNEAAKGVGAYEKTLKRVTDNVLWGSISDWQDDYAQATDKAAKAAERSSASSGTGKGKRKASAKNTDLIGLMIGSDDFQIAMKQYQDYLDFIDDVSGRAQKRQYEQRKGWLDDALRFGEISEGQYAAAMKKIAQTGEDTMNSLSVFGDQAARNIQTYLGDNLYDALKGDYDNILSGFADMLGRMAAQAASARIADAIFGGKGKGGGLFGDLLGAIGGGFSGGGSSYAPNVSGFFASGGFTGHGGKYQPAGIVHKGEYVLNQNATRRMGVQNLDRINKGYSDGGFVGGGVGMQPSGGVVIYNNAPGLTFEESRMSDGQIRLEINRQIATQTPRIMAREQASPNSRFSVQQSRSINASRRR